MNQVYDETTTPRQTDPLRRAFIGKYIILILLGSLLLLLLLLNFANFHLSSSRTVADRTVETGRTGETLPANMAPGFDLSYQVTGDTDLTTAVSATLPEALAATSVGEAAALADVNAATPPRLYVELDEIEQLWTPVYGRARVTAVIYFANVKEVPWPRAEPLVLTEVPEVMADGEITVTDVTWGLISRPAYDEMIGEALAEAIAAGLQENVFRLR